MFFRAFLSWRLVCKPRKVVVGKTPQFIHLLTECESTQAESAYLAGGGNLGAESPHIKLRRVPPGPDSTQVHVIQL